MSDNNIIEVMPPIIDDGGIVEIPPGPNAPVITPPADKAKSSLHDGSDRPLGDLPADKSQSELLEALRKERDRERIEREREKKQLTEAAAQRIQEERRRASEAERELHTRTGQAVRAHWQAVTSDLSQITNAISSTRQEIDAAKRDLALASEASDHAKLADAQERIALAAADLRALEHGKSGAEFRVEEARRAIEAMAAQAKREQDADRERDAKRSNGDDRDRPTQDAKQTRAPQTPDEWISSCPPATQDWLKTNKDYVTDPKLNRKLLRFADEWVDDNGLESLNTSAFVTALKGRFSKQQEKTAVAKEDDQTTDGDDGIIEIDPNPTKAKAEEPAQRRAAPAAPVSRSQTPGAPARTPTRVRLTPEQMAIAPQIYPKDPVTGRILTEAESCTMYAAHLLQAQADGKFQARE